MPPSPFFVAACLVLVPAVIVPPRAARAQSGGASSSLDLTLDTGADPARAATPSPSAAPRGAKPRFEGRAAVSSRGGALVRREAPQQSVLGKLGVVSSSKATIRQGRDGASRLLSTVPQGTYLAIISEVGEHYGVLMIDKTTGWVPRSAVQMINYQVAVGDPNAAVTPPPAATPPPGDLPGDVPQNLDPRKIALLREAFSYLGVPYVWAGNTRAGLDCSGFVKRVFASQGVSLPRHSGDQARVGMPVAWEDLQAGDRLYFDMGNKGRVSHTGIYLGNGYFIHASSNQKKVGVDSLLKPNYYKGLVGARRS